MSYTSVNHLGKSFNSTFGIARADSIKKLNTKIIGFLDLNFPISNHFNRFAVKKGFQINLLIKNKFSIPFIFSSTSIHRENFSQNRHDITFAMDFIPTLKMNRYNVSLYIGNELIAFSYIKSFIMPNNLMIPDNKIPDKNSFKKVKSHWEKPMQYIPKIGFQFLVNFSRFSIYAKSDIERNIYYQVDGKNSSKILWMNMIGFGYKFQKK